MENPLPIINKLMEEIFYDILTIEENALKASSFVDISITEVHTVEAVGLHQKQTMGEIAKKLGITVGTLTVAVNNLVKKGYVERFKCEDDRRVVKIDLTKKGRVLFRAHRMFHTKATQASIDCLTDQEVEALTSALIKVHRFLVSDYIKQNEGEDI